jgi:Ca2+-binding RTX toxin-like protein
VAGDAAGFAEVTSRNIANPTGSFTFRFDQDYEVARLVLTRAPGSAPVQVGDEPIYTNTVTVGSAASPSAQVVSYALPEGAQASVLQADAGESNSVVALIGNSDGQRLIGNSGVNHFDGGGGDDIYTGGRGDDVFIFSQRPGKGGHITVTDFESGDSLQLRREMFGWLAAGDLRATAFQVSNDGRAVDTDDRVIYDGRSGHLFFDADGSGAREAQLFATLEGAPSLAASDFWLI